MTSENISNESINLTFEEALNELQMIVEKLEKGNIPLDDMVKLYERGKKLSRYCEGKLKDVESQISRLEQVEESPKTVPEPSLE